MKKIEIRGFSRTATTLQSFTVLPATYNNSIFSGTS